jgi:Tat protein secretion system quality control protein TatD with DNase activity
MRAKDPQLKQVLLVCSRGCDRVEDNLRHAGYRVIKVADGTAAIERAKHEPLNAAVLISTGTQMDLAETVLNLKDINSSVAITIVVGSNAAEEKAAQTAAIVRAVPETSVVTIGEFDRYLASVAWKGRPAH